MTTVITDDEARIRIGANITSILHSKGLKQADLARLTEESTAQISRICGGKHLPNAALLCRISEALDVTMNQLMVEVGHLVGVS